jgi:hypothetical protein
MSEGNEQGTGQKPLRIQMRSAVIAVQRRGELD